ncbi:MAG: cytidine deaminase [Anaerolineae bacterium]
MTQPTQEALIQQAIAASERAYIPYSHYPVGAALTTPDGSTFTGCNVENASYPVGMCAERTALFKAVSEGHTRFDTLVVVTRDGGTPCGMCRQALYEFAPDLKVIIADLNGQVHHTLTLRDLLPHGFGPDHLLP